MTYTSPNTMTSALSLAKAGISKQNILYYLTNIWSIPDDVQEALGISQYYIRKWEGKYFKSKIAQGILHHNTSCDDRTDYIILYRDCTPAIAFKARELTISFRSSPHGNFALVFISDKSTYITDIVDESWQQRINGDILL